MRIEKINDNKIKVTVNKEDIKIWNVTIKNLTDNTPEARDLFWFALRQAEKDVNFKVGEAQLLVEALPHGGEEFIMFISKVNSYENVMDIIEANTKNFDKTVEVKVKKRTRSASSLSIFMFEDFESLCNCIKETEGLFFGNSSLYKYSGKFYLVLVPSDSMMFFETENIITEFATRVKNPAIFEGVLKEHGEKMIEEGAVETVLTYFK